jgi:hypothetical protein
VVRPMVPGIGGEASDENDAPNASAAAETARPERTASKATRTLTRASRFGSISLRSAPPGLSSRPAIIFVVSSSMR